MRFSRLIFALFLLLAVCMPAYAVSSSVDAPHVRVQLVIPFSALNRGESASAGLYFKLEPGWHIYWMNPGDAGEPPHIQWTLPAGITAGPLQFTSPKRLPLGPLMDYGYENEVLFPVTLNVATTAKPGLAVLHAHVDWLVCRGSCIPGKAELEISRPIRPSPSEIIPLISESDIYNRLIGGLPKSLPSNSKAIFQPAKEGFRLAVETGQKETEVTFFPEDQDILDNPAPQKLTPTTSGFVLELKQDANITANPAQLKGVIDCSEDRFNAGARALILLVCARA
jgi:thiol:disulfide interchange protein DsbD